MKYVLYFLALVAHGSFAQEKVSLDTIFANDFHNVSLFFQSPVRQGIVGAANFTFSFNEETPQYFGLLKAAPGNDSSLLVLTADGQIYSYYLKYREEISRLTYFISESESIGNEVPQIKNSDHAGEVKATVGERKVLKDSIARMSLYEERSAYYMHSATGNLKSKKKSKIKLSVKELKYYGHETYMIFDLENKSGIDFELNYLNVYLTSGSSKRNASFQKVLKDPIYIYGFPEVVKNGQRRRFVYVLPKFTVGENERIAVEVREKRGNRYLKLRFKQP